MDYSAASSGVSSKALSAPRGGEYNPVVEMIAFLDFDQWAICNTANE
jgi:hypothetical protein